MADAEKRAMSVEEFLQWNLSQDRRYELVDGYPVPLRALAGATAQHDTVVVNLVGLLGTQLRGNECRPRTANTAVRTKINCARRPDVTIESAPLVLGALEARKPIAVFEVLSPTTRKIDRSVRLQEYRRHPGLRTIVHIDPDEMDVLVYTRNVTGDWDDERFEQPETTIRIADMPVALRLADVYDGVPVRV